MAAIVRTWVTSSNEDGSATTYTFSSIALGAASGHRLIAIVGANNTAARTISSVTVDGVSAVTCGSAVTSTNTTVAFYIATASGNTTGDVVVEWSAGQIMCGVGVWNIANLGSTTPSHSVSDTTMVLGELYGGTVNNTAGGALFGIAFNRAATAFNWLGLTEDADVTIDAGTKRVTYASVELASATATTASATLTTGSGSGNEPAYLVVSLDGTAATLRLLATTGVGA